MKTIKYSDFNIGDYVYVTKYSDADPNDPWAIGCIDEIGKDQRGGFIRIYEHGVRPWRYAIKISKKEGELLLKSLKL